MTSHTSLSLALTFLDMRTTDFWVRLLARVLDEQYVWTDDGVPPTSRSPRCTLHAVAEWIELDSDDVFEEVDAAGWVERCPVPQLGIPGIVVARGVVMLIDDGSPAEFVSACQLGGLRNAGLVRSAWKRRTARGICNLGESTDDDLGRGSRPPAGDDPTQSLSCSFVDGARA
jgi:hypothetical protein